MSEGKHTQGPWYVSQVCLTNGGERPITTEDGRICTVDCQTPFKRGEGWKSECDVREANARLIAAAPETAAERDRLKVVNAELLDALKRLLEFVVAHTDPTVATPQFTAEYERSRAAIAKAEGGAA
jgi:hypothetical protein